MSCRCALKRSTTLSKKQRDWIASADTFTLGTYAGGQYGGADASNRGGNPGFVWALDDRTIVFPDYQVESIFSSVDISGRDQLATKKDCFKEEQHSLGPTACFSDEIEFPGGFCPDSKGPYSVAVRELPRRDLEVFSRRKIDGDSMARQWRRKTLARASKHSRATGRSTAIVYYLPRQHVGEVQCSRPSR